MRASGSPTYKVTVSRVTVTWNFKVNGEYFQTSYYTAQAEVTAFPTNTERVNRRSHSTVSR